jgi:hypothetical protein
MEHIPQWIFKDLKRDGLVGTTNLFACNSKCIEKKKGITLRKLIVLFVPERHLVFCLVNSTSKDII